MFFDISLKIAIAVNVVAIIANGALCFMKDHYRVMDQLKGITVQCRWVGVLYFIFAWFMGNGSLVDSGRTTYDQVAYWLIISSIGWLFVFIFTLVSKLWNSDDTLSSKALFIGITYFVLAYLLH